MSEPGPTSDTASRAGLRLGWTMVALFMAMGLVLESLHLFKSPFYLEVRLRRELFTLAHAHGTLLGLVNVVFALTAQDLVPSLRRRQGAALLLRTGSVLLPLGFLLGGVGNAEGDPSLFIVLVPVGGLLCLAALATVAAGAWRERRADARQAAGKRGR